MRSVLAAGFRGCWVGVGRNDVIVSQHAIQLGAGRLDSSLAPDCHRPLQAHRGRLDGNPLRTIVPVPAARQPLPYPLPLPLPLARSSPTLASRPPLPARPLRLPAVPESDVTQPHLSSPSPQVLGEETQGEAIITTGVGQHQMWAAQWYPYKEPRRWISSGGLGSMGFGLPAALGAAVAFDGKQGRESRVVVDIDGDGSFLMNCQVPMTWGREARISAGFRKSNGCGWKGTDGWPAGY